MPAIVLILPLLAAAAQAPASATDAITVTGHSWAPFISPMGEPFRASSASDDTLADWFRQADRNHDGVITAAEMQADAERFFATLDTRTDGELDPDEIAAYEWDVAPDVQVNARTLRMPGEPASRAKEDAPQDSYRRRASRHQERLEPGGLQGGARYGLLNIPEPVAAADTDFDRGITLGEFRQAAVVRFALLDAKRLGRLTIDELQAVRTAALNSGKRPKRDLNAPDMRVGNPLPTRD
jgi:hypothetical protein